MLDLGFVRSNLELVETKLRSRGMDPAAVLGDFRAIDNRRREAITRSETAKAERNRLSAEIQSLRKSGADATAQTETVRSLKSEGETLEAAAAEADEQLRTLLETIPNLPQDSVPIGPNELSNKVVKTWGAIKHSAFPALNHWDLGERLGILDFERAAKISGARFVVQFGQGARLERALANFMLDLHTKKHGYTEVLPPTLVNSDSLYGTGQLPKFEEDLFKIPSNKSEIDIHHIPIVGEPVDAMGMTGDFIVEKVNGWNVHIRDVKNGHMEGPIPRGALFFKRKLYLIPTAEVPVTNIFRDETLDESALTLSLCAYTSCFRSEAGSHGKDTRGLIRQHQFQKVELVKFTRPQDSESEHERLTQDAESILEALNLPYRRMLLSTGDMGFGSAKTYDLEVWLPGQQTYREISSCTNFEAFQARRANIRYRATGAKKPEYLHTINGSGLAVGRTYVAILENYQQPDGTIRIPEALIPYMDGETVIARQAGAWVKESQSK